MWRKEAERLKFDEHKSWTEIIEELRHYFPNKKDSQIREAIRAYIRRLPRYKEIQKQDHENSSLEYKKDGSIISEKFITIRDGDDMTPEYIIEAHGLNPCMWEVVSYKNNFWNTQVKGGSKQISYQSKLTVKPRSKGIDISEIDKHFKTLDRRYKAPKTTYKKHDGQLMAEVNIADLHLGKLCWHGDTGNNFDYKIARDMFYNIVQRIGSELQNKNLEYITFVWANDFLMFFCI